MTLERGFRRIVMVISIAALSIGLALTAILTTATVWVAHLERQSEAALLAEGCPREKEPFLAEMTVRSLGTGRWRVTIPEGGYALTVVVSARQSLSVDEVIKAAKAPARDSELGKGRRHPMPDIEVIDCAFEEMELAAERNGTLSNRLLDWWMKRPGVMLSMVWIFLTRFRSTRGCSGRGC